jgi:hypothetical protein
VRNNRARFVRDAAQLHAGGHPCDGNLNFRSARLGTSMPNRLEMPVGGVEMRTALVETGLRHVGGDNHADSCASHCVSTSMRPASIDLSSLYLGKLDVKRVSLSRLSKPLNTRLMVSNTD